MYTPVYPVYSTLCTHSRSPPLTTCLFRPVKRGLLLPDLKSKSGKFLHRIFFSLNFFLPIYCKKYNCPIKSHPLSSQFFTLFWVVILTCFFHFSYSVCLVPSQRVPLLRFKPGPLGESHNVNPIYPDGSSKAWCRLLFYPGQASRARIS